MPLPIIANVIRCTVYGTVEGGVGWSNTFHFKKGAGDTFAQAMGDASVPVTNLYTAAGFGGTNFGWPHYATDASFANQIVMTPLDGVTASQTFVLGTAGVSAQNPLPAQNAVAVTSRTIKRGRSFRGRVFWPANSREVIDGSGKFGAANVVFVESAWNAFIAALAATPHPSTFVVASYHLLSSETVIGFTCRATYAHQTARRGRGA
jgi:hypothetical protein